MNTQRTDAFAPANWPTQLDALFDLSAKLSSILSLNELLEYAAWCIPVIVPARRVAVFLHLLGSDRLNIVASSGLSNKVVAELTYAKGEGLIGQVLESGQTLTSEVDPIPSLFPGDGTEEQVRAIAVPIMYMEQPLGVLALEREADAPPYNEPEGKCLAIITTQLATCAHNSRLFSTLEQRIEHMSTVQEIGNLLVSTLELDNVLDLVVQGIGRVSGADKCSIMLLEDDHLHMRVRAAIGLPEHVKNAATVKVGEGISGWVAQHGKPLLIRDIEKDEQFGKSNASHYQSKSLLSVPLLCKGKVLGVVNINSTNPNTTWTESDQNLLTHFASQAAIAIENARLYERLTELATTDPVTGIFNHRAFQETLTKEMSRAERQERTLSLLMLDVDHFKNVNDTLGHQKGDAVLRLLGCLLHHNLRAMDTAARYGGEEFTVILPETIKKEAVHIAERLRHAVETNDSEWPENAHITISIGVSTYPDDADDKNKLIAVSDTALYKAKHNGRNRVETI